MLLTGPGRPPPKRPPIRRTAVSTKQSGAPIRRSIHWSVRASLLNLVTGCCRLQHLESGRARGEASEMLGPVWHPSCYPGGMKNFPLRPLAITLLLGAGTAFTRAADRIPIKVIALSGFEVGDDTGDAPGEFQFWVEREKLTERVEVPGAPHALLHNAEGLYADVAGNTRDPQMTPLPATELVMALCLDPQLDLRRTYWIMNGIAGIDPAAGPMGSAVWAENVVDGDAMREIDESEAPSQWPYGLFAIGTDTPAFSRPTGEQPAAGAAPSSSTQWHIRSTRGSCAGPTRRQGSRIAGFAGAQGLEDEIHRLSPGADGASGDDRRQPCLRALLARAPAHAVGP